VSNPRRDAGLLRGAAVFAVALVASAMCTHGEITVVEPAAKPPNDTLAITFLPDGEDGAAAAALGWTTGIPGAQVILAPSVKPNPNGPGDTATGPPIATLVTDSAGRVSVPDLPEGWYYVEVRRWLTDAERARLTPGADLIGFMTQAVVERGSVTLSVPGSHRRSIVVSEVSNFPEWDPINGCCYYDGDYLELANNSDTTVYLDGLVLALFGADSDIPQGGVCTALLPFDNDPGGVWVFLADSLPGTGHDHPLAPGAVAVVATDAMDHRTNSPQDGLDLSHANFEMLGTGDADNPGVPNTIPIGWNDRAYMEHGLVFGWGTSWGVVVALPVDTASLPKQMKLNHLAARLPRDRILDVVLVFWPNLVTVYNELCPILVNGAFDRRPAPLMINSLPGQSWHTLGQYSVQRKVAYTRADGRKIAQHTRSTQADFFVGLRTPFQLP
jgi:hypothetical protein